MKKFFNSIYLWLDAEAIKNELNIKMNSISWVRCIPFFVTHLACLAVFWVGSSQKAIIVCLISYFVRMFAITGFYHRYFSHRSFKTSRIMQFVFAVLGASAAQRGPLWWSARHRIHHKYSDQPEDPHSPAQHGFLTSHFGWFMKENNFITDKQPISDLLKYPELIFLNRYDVVVPLIYALFLYFLGGMQYVVWGYFISTVFLYHATFLINSLAHTHGKQKFETNDSSRNNWFLALITLGEGWHNNHHYWPSSVRQGFRFWELDITYLLLKLLNKLGLIWSLRFPPKDVISAK